MRATLLRLPSVRLHGWKLTRADGRPLRSGAHASIVYRVQQTVHDVRHGNNGADAAIAPVVPHVRGLHYCTAAAKDCLAHDAAADVPHAGDLEHGGAVTREACARPQRPVWERLQLLHVRVPSDAAATARELPQSLPYATAAPSLHPVAAARSPYVGARITCADLASRLLTGVVYRVDGVSGGSGCVSDDRRLRQSPPPQPQHVAVTTDAWQGGRLTRRVVVDKLSNITDLLVFDTRDGTLQPEHSVLRRYAAVGRDIDAADALDGTRVGCGSAQGDVQRLYADWPNVAAPAVVLLEATLRDLIRDAAPWRVVHVYRGYDVTERMRQRTHPH